MLCYDIYNMKKNTKKTTYTPFSKVKREMMHDRECKQAYENIQPKYVIIRAVLDARTKHGLTQAQLAKRVGTTQSAIARFESGAGNPTLDFLSKISYVLGKRIHVVMK
mgnify:CR=1 FL=1